MAYFFTVDYQGFTFLHVCHKRVQTKPTWQAALAAKEGYCHAPKRSVMSETRNNREMYFSGLSSASRLAINGIFSACSALQNRVS
ncbi:MAG: hypothetical protein KDC75_17925 [Phaeodactylibacter sp.]|nr:hypothetical protein [Phaeodactylibacter sp.]